MPRKPRPESSTGYYHWINRGVNQKHIFHSKDDYLWFLQLLAEHKLSYAVEINHYCLMPNHIHLLLRCPQKGLLSRFSQIIQRRYAYYYCKTYKWRGQVFQRMYKGLPVNRTPSQGEALASINIEIVGASHYDYMLREDNLSNIINMLSPSEQAWNRTVSDFVAAMISRSQDSDRLRFFLLDLVDAGIVRSGSGPNHWIVELPGWESRQ